MTSARPRLCVLGSINQDLVIQTPRFPRPGETLLGGSLETFPGGKGANQAVAAARMGAQVDFLGCVGDDDGGRLGLAALRAAGVEVAGIDVCPTQHTGIGIITVSPEGENHIVVAMGANYSLTSAWVERHSDRIRAADALLLQLEVPLEANRCAARIACAAGIPVILNAAPACALPDDFLAQVHTLIVNQHEFELLGHPEVPRLIVTYGKGGAVCWQQEPDGSRSETRQPSFPVEPIDTTAAGDAFCAASTVASLESPEPASFLSWGTAAGALTCTRRGAIPALPERAEIAALRRRPPLSL